MALEKPRFPTLRDPLDSIRREWVSVEGVWFANSGLTARGSLILSPHVTLSH
jgi:hypothetical protein